MRRKTQGPRRRLATTLLAAGIVPALFAAGCWRTNVASTGTSAPDPAGTVAVSSSAPTTTSTTAPELSIDEEARQAVFAYLNALAAGDFETAASCYGDVLTGWGTTKAEGMQNAVRLRRVFPPRLVRVESHGWEQIVWVQLIQPDGKPYVSSPPEGSPTKPRDEFPFTALRVDGRWWVMDLPPYEE
ncbi:MAG: hypothetical protein ACYC5F_11170 [Thermoleophilia bacterium]